jgi:non-specific serine/threonine protein kinase
MATLVIRLFGPPEILVRGERLPPLRSRKGLWLLALLTLRRERPVERSWLAGTLWTDSAEGQAHYNLRRSLLDLRRALGPEVGRLRSPTPHTLLLDLTGAEADAATFDAAISAGDAASLARAVELYRGPLLEGCAEEWAFEERQAREGSYLAARERLAALALERGDTTEAERHLRRAVAVDPLRESTQRALMQALVAGGNYAAALHCYRELRERLHRELNTEPDPETKTLFQQLRGEARRLAAKTAGRWATTLDLGPEQGRPPEDGGTSEAPGAARSRPPAAPASPAAGPAPAAADLRHQPPALRCPHNLPLELTSFVGRDVEIAEVTERLVHYRLVTLTGAGGCGKTRLALRVAADLREQFEHGVWRVELAPLADPALVPQAVGAALGLPEVPGCAFTDTLTETLRHRQLLLVLDNCEHLVTACASLVEALLQSCPSLRILATSREPLRIGGEAPYRVPSLSLPVPVESLELRVESSGNVKGSALSDLSTLNSQLSTVARSEAVRLFVERATTVSPDFRLTLENAGAVAQICRCLEGMPLAIELAAARVKALPAKELHERLKDMFRLLTRGSRTALPRHQTLRATMDWSYDLLSPAEQGLFRRLSAFAGGFPLEAAEAVCGGDGVEDVEVLDLLTSLVEKSLVLYEAQESEGRYRLLEPVRQYARDRQQEAGGGAAVRSRHLDFFARLAERAEPELDGPDQVAWLDRLEQEHDNLRAALAWSGAQGRENAGLRLGGALGWFWFLRGHLGEGQERLAGLLALPGAAPRTAARAKALKSAGWLAWNQGDHGLARALFEESLAIFREIGNKGGIADSLVLLGGAARHQADYGTARALFEEGRAIYQELGNKAGIAGSILNLGGAAHAERDHEGARALLEGSLAIFRELGKRGHIAQSLGQLGWVARAQGDYGAARAFFEEGLAIFRELGAAVGVAWLLNGLGIVAEDQGGHGGARALLEESLAIFRARGHKRGVVADLEGLAAVTVAQGEPERAARLFGAGEGLRGAMGVPLHPADRAEHDRSVAAVRAALGEAAFAAAWAAGRAMTLEQAVDFAREK